MMSRSNFSKVLILANIAIFITSTILIMGCSSHSQEPKKLAVDTKEQPTIGNPNSSVQVVVFEEPKCPGCKKYSTLLFPLLKQDFIDTNKISYTLIPVSFIPNSMPAAEAWLCVYHPATENPNSKLVFDYVDYTYSNQPSEDIDWATKKNLIKYAKETNPAIDLSRLKNCLSSETYRELVEKNTAYANKLMNGELSTPAIYINGVLVDEVNYDNISEMINKALQEKQ